MPEYPEADKMAQVIDDWDVITAFLDSLPDGYGLAKFDYEKTRFYTVAEPVSDLDRERLLAGHSGIDLDALEKERRHMLDVAAGRINP